MGAPTYTQLLLRYALRFAILLPTAALAFFPMRGFLKRDARVVYPIVAAVLLLFVAVASLVCARMRCPASWVLFACGPVLFALYCQVVDVAPIKALFCFLFAAVLGAYSSVLVEYLLAPIELGDAASPTLPLLSLASMFIEGALGVVFYDSLTVKLPRLLEEDDSVGPWFSASLATLLLLVIISWVSPLDFGTLAGGRVRPVALVVLGLLPFLALFLFDMVWTLAANLLENARLRQENGMLLMEERRYAQLRDYMDSTRKLRHDFRQHLRVIDNLAHEDRKEELLAYLDQLGESTGEGQRRLCANHAVDAVASYYDAQAASQKVTIDWLLEIPEGVFVTDVELCALLGNLVENALHAVAKLDEERRTISVTAKLLSKAMLGITVRNPYEGQVKLDRKGLPKARKRGHGIGLDSVDATVKRYDGSLQIDTEDGLFSVSILMYGPTPEP